MRIVRFLDETGQARYGAEQADGSVRVIDGDLFGAWEVTDTIATAAKRLAPIAPTQIIAIGMNYRQHAEETGAKIPEYPIVFFKGLNSLQHPNCPIEIPTHLRSDQVDYECELGVVIGKPCKNVARADAFSYVLGYTAANDVSARDWQIQRGGTQWGRAKSFDTFCPVGPALVTADEIPNPNALGIKTLLNGETVQDWNTNDMIFDIPALIEFLSGSTTLLPGTLILTGTPQGVGMARTPPLWLKPGDTVTVEIERIGALTNPVIEEAA